jgi:hypothetical protein
MVNPLPSINFEKGDGIVQTTNNKIFLWVVKTIVVKHNLETQVQVLAPQQVKLKYHDEWYFNLYFCVGNGQTALPISGLASRSHFFQHKK